MSELTIPTPIELESYKSIAHIAASNPHWRKLGGGGDVSSTIATILSVILLGRELGLPAMFTVSGGINNIQGKFELSARAMNMLIRKQGHLLRVKCQSNEVCTIWGKRKDTGEEMECSFHIEEAARAGLIKTGGAWTKTPSDMLFARAISRLTRRLFSDCIGGCYVEGEIQETVLKQPLETIDVPPINEVNCEQAVEVQAPEFQLPEDVDAGRVEMFMIESARASNRELDYVKAKASRDLDKMLAAYHAWEDKQLVT